MNQPWSIASLLRKEKREWRKNNDLRRRLRHRSFDRELLKGGERPIRYAFSLTVLLLTLNVLGYFAASSFGNFFPTDLFIGPWYSWNTEEQLGYFTSLWSIQATIAVLVYPFVISFVALLLQRRPSSKAFLQIYLVDSGALVAGMSSLFLVLSMAVQYMMFSVYSIDLAAAWVMLDAAWFIYNIVLTVWFLYHTVEFLRSDFQMEVVKRYVANVAIPREIGHLMRFQFFATAQEKGWIPGPTYLQDGFDGKPQVLMNAYGRGMGTVSVKTHVRNRSRLTNVFYWPLRLVVASWLKTARKQEQQAGDQPRKSPVLVFPLLPGDTYEAEVVLASVENGPSLSLWQRALVHISFWFAPLHFERRYVSSAEILAELETEARVAAGSGDVVAFEEAYRRLTEMHETLLGSSLAKADDGGTGSWALLPDVLNFADRPIHHHWANSYRSLYDAAASLLPKESRPIRQLCHVVQHLDGPEIQQSPLEVHERLLVLPMQLMYSLENWWSQRLEEQGIFQHGPNDMELLRPPLQGAYENTLLEFVGGWDRARQVLADIPDDKDFDWINAKNWLKLNTQHVEHTCSMLLRAVARGDKVAAEWFADVISKWWISALSGDDDTPFILYDKLNFITVEAANQEWSVVEQSLGLDENDLRFINNDISRLHRPVCVSALKNYWRDVRLLTLEILLSWAAEETQLDEKSLAVYIATGFLTGREWRPGGRADESLSELSAALYLTAKARQFAADGGYRQGYVAHLDRFVESAKDLRRPDMVPLRIYSYSGADDVQSLQEAQLVLFVVLSDRDWSPDDSLRRQLAVWISSNYDSTDRLKYRAEAMKTRLEEVGNNLKPQLVDRLLTVLGKTHSRPDGVARVRNAIDALLNEVTALQTDAIANAQVSQQRLNAIEEAASEKGFSKETGEFPLQIFSSVSTNDAPQEPFILTFSNRRKGELTDVEMAQRASNERDYYSQTLADHVGGVVLWDVIRKSEVKEVTALDPTTYWSALKEEAGMLQGAGLTPMLILDNPTRPEWVWEWAHPRQETTHARPSDLVVRRLKDMRGNRYIADFNEIQVFSAPLAYGESLLVARETFVSVTFRRYRDRVYVKAGTAEVPGSNTLVNLQLTYERRVQVEHNRIVRIRYALAKAVPEQGKQK